MVWKAQKPSGVVSPGLPNYPDEMLTKRVHVLFAIFLTALAVAAGYLQYFARPIACWCPPQFTGSMVDFANSRCFFTDGFYLPMSDVPVPSIVQNKQVNYFKWTPFGLLFLAALYIIPELTVRLGSKLSLPNLNSFLKLSSQCKDDNNEETHDAAMQHLTADLRSRLDENEARSKLRRWTSGFLPSLPVHMWLRYLTSKLIFFLGSLIPLVFLYNICQPKLTSKNDRLFSDNTTTQNLTYFPKVILCDFWIRHLQNVHEYTLQCDVSANDMFERISRLVGFLALVVSSVNSSDVIRCLVTRLFEPRNSTYVKRHMKLLTDLSSGHEMEICREFLERYLREDGMYLLHLIGENSSEGVVDQVLSRLWEGYKVKVSEVKSALPTPYHNGGYHLLENPKIHLLD